MESTCTIRNDTDFDVWMIHGGNWNGLLHSIAAASAAQTQTDGVDATDDSTEGGTTKKTPNVIGGTMSRMDIIQNFSATALAETFGLSQEEAEKLKKEVTNFVSSATKVSPGGTYKWRSTYPKTLSIVYVLKDTLQCDGRGCNTGFFTNIDYTISERFEFQKLDK